MPKLIDLEARSEDVHAAVCRIVAAEGVAAATVRRVASEAGLSPNALRYNWPSQDQLLLRTVQRLAHRWYDDWPQWTTTADPVDFARAALRSLVPLDAKQLPRARAWLAFTHAVATDPVMAQVICRAERELRRALRDQVRALRGENPLDADALEAETLRMLVLVKGLTAMVCDHQTPLSPEEAVLVIDRQLAEITTPR